MQESLNDRTEWPDAWLIRAAAAESPDEAALDVLVQRHWKWLHARCALLTADRDAARDLAQETWVRVLRARRTLDPQGRFPAYLATIATNLWRDRTRAARRAGPLESFEDEDVDHEASSASRNAGGLEESLVRSLDVQRVLAGMSPRARDVLISRFIDGESAAEIGRRYGRTEQTITQWIRQAIAEVRERFGAELSGEMPARESR